LAAENLRFVSRHVLLTGFGPFGPHAVNPSELLTRSLEGRIIGGCIIDARILPIETRPLRDRLAKALDETRPQAVIGLGYAPGRAALALERIAVNVLDFPLPDTAGVTRKNEPIDGDGPDGRLSTLPSDEIVAAWDEGGVPGYVSNSAGTYLCNQWLYEALALAAALPSAIPAGFVHVPALPAQAKALGADRTPSMSLELMQRGIETAIEITARRLDAAPASPPPRAAGESWIPGRTKR
jgi:pyroglutamyl-peptidase